MNKAELAAALAQQTGFSKAKASEVIDKLFTIMARMVCEGEPVRITGFGTFKARPSRGQARPKFTPHTELKELVSKKLRVVEASGKPTLVKAVR